MLHVSIGTGKLVWFGYVWYGRETTKCTGRFYKALVILLGHPLLVSFMQKSDLHAGSAYRYRYQGSTNT